MKLRAVLLAFAVVTVPAHTTEAGICSWGGGLDVIAWSPDGGALAAALIHETTSCANATLVVSDGRSFRELKPYSSAAAQTLRWSPDGRRLVAAWQGGELEVYDIATGARTALLDGLDPVWAPDGGTIAYVRRDGAASVALYEVASGTLRTLAEGSDPAWSPDGRTMAYAREGVGVHLIAPDGTEERFVGPGGSPAWSPDSTRVAYAHAGSIFVSRSDGTSPTRVAAGTSATWSPDGTALAIARGGAIYLHPLDGSRDRRLGRGEPMHWSPSGEELALLTRANNVRIMDFRGVVRLVNVRSGESRRIAEDVETADFRPQWDRIATVLRVWLEPEIYIAEATGARPRRISPSQCEQENPRCLDGSDGSDRIVGTARRDVVFAGAGDDRVWGRGGLDHIATAYGRDFVVGGAGNDTVVTHGNDDRLYGGTGRDHLTAGDGEDFVDAGPGNDWVNVAGDGRVDRVRCGSGRDTGYADRIDRVARDCEDVKPPPS